MPEYNQCSDEGLFAEADYDFQVVDAGEKESTTSHNTMIELQLDCFNDDFTEKIRVVDRLVFVPNSYWKIDSFRRATGEKLSQKQKISFEAEDCIDRKGRVHLKQSSYNGRMRNEVDYYIEPSAAVPASSSSPPQPRSWVQATKGSVPTANQPF